MDDRLGLAIHDVLPCAQSGQPVIAKVEFHVDVPSLRFDGTHLVATVDPGIAATSLAVGVMQAVVRFAAYLSGPSGWSLLHGSAAVARDGRAVICADGSHVIGKTSLAVEVALQTGAFLGDEFLFLEPGGTLSCGLAPIHLRPGFCTHLAHEHGISVAVTDAFGLLATVSQLGLSYIARAPVGCVLLFNPSDELSVTEMEPRAAMEELTIALWAHHAKFLDPSLDRVSAFHSDRLLRLSMDDLYSVARPSISIIQSAEVLAHAIRTFRITAPTSHDAALIAMELI